MLGWSNQEKINAIEKDLDSIKQRIGIMEKEKQSNEDDQRNFKKQEESVRDFLKYTKYGEIHWQKDAAEIEELKRERQDLEKSRII